LTVAFVTAAPQQCKSYYTTSAWLCQEFFETFFKKLFEAVFAELSFVFALTLARCFIISHKFRFVNTFFLIFSNYFSLDISSLYIYNKITTTETPEKL